MIGHSSFATPTLFLPLLGGGKSVWRPRRFMRRNARAACSSLPLKWGGIGWGSREGSMASRFYWLSALLLLTSIAAGQAGAQSDCPTVRKINVGVSVAPPNVVHTSPYVAKALGLFQKRCIDATIIQFEGGQS